MEEIYPLQVCWLSYTQGAAGALVRCGGDAPHWFVNPCVDTESRQSGLNVRAQCSVFLVVDLSQVSLKYPTIVVAIA